MSKPDQYFTDSILAGDYFTHCILCIHLNAKTLSYGVFSNDNNAAVSFGRFDLDSTTMEASLDFEVFNQQFFRIVISENNPNFSLVPHVLAEEFKSMQKELNYSEHTEISDLDARIYSLPTERLSLILKKFPQAEVLNFNAEFISNVLLKNKYQPGIKIYAHLSKSEITLLKIASGKLISFTSETLSEPSEAIYFISSHVESSGFNQLEDKLVLSGDVSLGDDVYEHFSQRIKNISFNNGLSYQKISAQLSGCVKHQFFPVINAFQCA